MKTLIVYASKTGTTQDAAKAVAGLLSEPCDMYDCRSRTLYNGNIHAEKVSIASVNLTEYGIIVIGSAMYIGKPMKEITQFCAKREKELQQKNLAFFTCGVGTAEEDKTYLWRCLPESIKQKAALYCHLGGEIRENRMSTFARMAMREYVKQHGPAQGINRLQIENLSSEIEKMI